MELSEDVRHALEGKETYTLRGQTIERVFADAKEKHFMRYTYYRGLEKLRMQVLLTFAPMKMKEFKPHCKERKGDLMANKTNSLSHTKWMCKYYIAFTPKYR